MADYKQLCAKVLAYYEGQGEYDFSNLGAIARDNAAFDAWQEIKAELKHALAEPEPVGPPMFKPDEVHPFVVRHYTDDQRPSIKGNGFDGLEVGEDRQEAEEFIAWINARLFPSRSI